MAKSRSLRKTARRANDIIWAKLGQNGKIEVEKSSQRKDILPLQKMKRWMTGRIKPRVKDRWTRSQESSKTIDPTVERVLGIPKERIRILEIEWSPMLRKMIKTIVKTSQQFKAKSKSTWLGLFMTEQLNCWSRSVQQSLRSRNYKISSSVSNWVKSEPDEGTGKSMRNCKSISNISKNL